MKITGLIYLRCQIENNENKNSNETIENMQRTIESTQGQCYRQAMRIVSDDSNINGICKVLNNSEHAESFLPFECEDNY